MRQWRVVKCCGAKRLGIGAVAKQARNQPYDDRVSFSHIVDPFPSVFSLPHPFHSHPISSPLPSLPPSLPSTSLLSPFLFLPFSRPPFPSPRSRFTVRRYALHGLCDRSSVYLSVCTSVCLSVTLVDCVHTVQPRIMVSSHYGSTIIIVSADITIIPQFEGGHPERGRWMRVGWVRIGDFRPIRCRISETVRDTTKVTINH